MKRPAPQPAELLSRFIAKKGLKSTRQRSGVLAELVRAGGHVSADDLYARLRSSNASVSAATVYRTLKLLTESGLVHAQKFGDGSTRYEAVAGREHHDHLICVECGRIVEFEDSRIERQQERIARERGFVLKHHRMDLFGLCPDCQRDRCGPPSPE